MGSEVYGKTLGVIGLGKIGREVAKRLQSFEMHVIGYDPYLKPEQAEALGIKLVDLDTLYKESDYITVHVPKTKETTGMINAEKLALDEADRAADQCRARRHHGRSRGGRSRESGTDRRRGD